MRTLYEPPEDRCTACSPARAADVVARILARQLTPRPGQSFVAENRLGVKLN
jgi:hypothetical protein